MIGFAVSKNFNVAPSAVKYSRDINGKPYCINMPTIHFNLSHTRNALICATSNQYELGVDIERHKSINYDIIERICNKDEISFIFSYPKNKRDNAFYKIWTRKEAYCKCSGIGLRTNLKNINTLTPEKDSRFITWNDLEYTYSIYCNINERVEIEYLEEKDIDLYYKKYI